MLLGFSVYILSYDRSGWGTTQTCFLAKILYERVDNEKEDNFRYWNTPTELNYGQEASSGFLTFLMILRWQDAQTSFNEKDCSYNSNYLNSRRNTNTCTDEGRDSVTCPLFHFNSGWRFLSNAPTITTTTSTSTSTTTFWKDVWGLGGWWWWFFGGWSGRWG